MGIMKQKEWSLYPRQRVFRRAHCHTQALLFGRVSSLFLMLLSFNLSAEESLSERSPFLPPGYGVENMEPKKPEVQQQGPISRELDFRGIVEIDGQFQFSIFNKKEQKSYWLREDSSSESGILVSSYSPQSSSIIVTLNGRSERLTLASPTDTPLSVGSSAASTGGTKSATSVLPPQLQNPNNNRSKVPPRSGRRVVLPTRTN